MNEQIQNLIDVSVALERQQCAANYLKIMRDAVKEARAKERESCANICDKFAIESSNPMNFSENCAAAIRARKTE